MVKNDDNQIYLYINTTVKEYLFTIYANILLKGIRSNLVHLNKYFSKTKTLLSNINLLLFLSQ